MRWSWLVAAVVVPVTVTGAMALDCGFSTTPAPDNTAYSVIFNDFSTTPGNPSTCNVAVPIAPLSAGVIAVYSADYRGFVSDGDVVQTIVGHDGTVSQAIVPGTYDGAFDGPYLSHLIGGSGDTIPSDITLALLTYTDPSTSATLDTIDYLEIARTTTGDIQASLNRLFAQRAGVVVHLDATADLVAGAGQPLEEKDWVGLIGGIGSATLGIGARMSLGDGFTVIGGAAWVDQAVGGATTQGVLFSGALRYVSPSAGRVRPLAEIGARGAPELNIVLSRSYATGAGTSIAGGSTTGMFAGVYGKAGVLFAPDPTNEIVLSATLAKDWLQTGAYTETMTGSNLFAANAPAQTSGSTRIKAGVDWTTRAFAFADLTFSAALGHTFAEDGLAANVAFAGPFTSTAPSETFAEYGARASFDLTSSSTVGVFIFGATGENSGTHAQLGADLHVNF